MVNEAPDRCNLVVTQGRGINRRNGIAAAINEELALGWWHSVEIVFSTMVL